MPSIHLPKMSNVKISILCPVFTDLYFFQMSIRDSYARSIVYLILAASQYNLLYIVKNILILFGPATFESIQTECLV